MNGVANIPHEVRVRVHQEPDGKFWAEATDLPGCYTQGESLDAALNNMKDAVLTYFEVPGNMGNGTQLTYEGETRGKFIVREKALA